MPVMAAVTGASAVLTVSLDQIGTENLGVAVRKPPSTRRCEAVECDAVVVAKIGRLPRNAARSKIGRAGANDVTDRSDAVCNHAAVRQDADPNREIDSLLEQVDNMIAEEKTQIDVRICRQEFQRDRQQVQVSEH